MMLEKRMPPKLDDEIKRLQLVVPQRLISRIDAWRARQPGVPNTSQAIRKLIETSLDAAEADDKPKPKKGRQ
jgi:metal-responsive CopG/Arc/MetJ family transcriptional regulator